MPKREYIHTLSSVYDMVTVLRVGKGVWEEHDISRHVIWRENWRLDGDGE